MLNKSDKHRGQVLIQPSIQQNVLPQIHWGVLVPAALKESREGGVHFPLAGPVQPPDYSTVLGVPIVAEVMHHRLVSDLLRDIEDVKCRADVTAGVTAACFSMYNAHSSLNDVKFSRDGSVVR